MNYTAEINEAKRTVTVRLSDGSIGIARCNPTDKWDTHTGIELALERAKNTAKSKPMTVMELIKALEKALPEGDMVIVGNGKQMTETQKAWVRSLVGCECRKVNDEELDDAYNKGKQEGYRDGYEDGYEKGFNTGYDNAADCCEECHSDTEAEKLREVIRKMFDLLSD